jgi:outer membrane biosynthesis protein TonB
MRRQARPGKKPLLASVGIHALVLLAAWSAQMAAPKYSEFVAYQVQIVSPPPAQMAETPQPQQEQELVVETPEPLPTPEEPEPVVQEERVREESRPEPTPTPPPETTAEAGHPDPSEEAGGEDINVRMEGLRRDFPGYYENIIRQIDRCMRFSGPEGLKTSVYFTIRRDGTVDGNNIDFVSRSGNAGFDFAVMGAIECAGRGRFGPLPEDLGWDRLPIIFEVTSSRRLPYPDPPEHPRGPLIPSNSP